MRTLILIAALAALILCTDAGAQSMTRVNLSSAGMESAPWGTYDTSISADGQWVAFRTKSSNLVAGDINNKVDIFRRDRDPDGDGVFDTGNGTTIRVSETWDGSLHLENSYLSRDAVSGDGKRIVFWTIGHLTQGAWKYGQQNTFLWDATSGGCTLLSQNAAGEDTDGATYDAVISDDGSTAAFACGASNLLPGYFAGGYTHIYVVNLATGALESASKDFATGGPSFGITHRPSLSGDGRWVAFSSTAFDLVPGDTNAKEDVFVYDRVTGTTVRVSVKTGQTQVFGYASFAPSISDDGRYVSFHSTSGTIVSTDFNIEPDVFVHDRDPDGNGVFDEGNGTTVLVSVDSLGLAAGDATSGSLSADGRYVSFLCSNPVITGFGNGFLQVYVRDRDPEGNGVYDDGTGAWLEGNGETTLVSRTGPSGVLANGGCNAGIPKLARNGEHVAFGSYADNLVSNDTNGWPDTFVHDMSRWRELGFPLAGTPGTPHVVGAGTLADNTPVELTLSGALAGSTTNLVMADARLLLPFKRGVLVPDPQLVLLGFPVDASGKTELTSVWPPGLPVGFELVMQFWTSDPGAPKNYSASPGIVATQP
jgi:hypothetical protein